MTRRFTTFSFFSFSVFLLLSICGCASPGDPLERKALVPSAVQDLSAEQSGNTVILSFTLPRETADHRVLKRPPDIEIYRNLSAPGASSALQPSSASLLVTIPSDMVSHYSEQGRVRYPDVLKPEDLAQHSNKTAMYIVRTRASQKKASPDSNVAALRMYPAADPLDDLKAEVMHSVVILTWTPPQKTPVGPAPPVKKYTIYRAEIPGAGASAQQPQFPKSPPAAASPAQPPPAATVLKPRFTQIAESEAPHYEDSQVNPGKTYAYAVRSVLDYSGEEIESNGSNVVTITVRDTVPPSAPQGLLVVFVPADAETPAHLELSWSINPETDIAGYNVYRTEEQGTSGRRLNADLLPTPTFRDMSAVPGYRYFYSVTAVDRSGNESSPGAAVAGEVPADTQPKL